MEYFEEEGPQLTDDIISAAPETSPGISSETSIPENKEIQPETIEFSKNIVNHLKPQENKYWRFSFKNEINMNDLIKAIKGIQSNLTVEFGIPQNTPDIIIKEPSGETIGKINLLLCDRRDANMPEKYYCKIYFYQFKNSNQYDSIKTAVVNFFENLKRPSMVSKETGGKRNRKRGTIKRKRYVNKKKSMKRR
jgi:hypothetical protein